MHAAAVIPAAGAGVRMGADTPKQFLELAGRPILSHTLERFERHSAIAAVIVAGPAGNLDAIRALVEEYGFQKVLDVIEGGEHRQESVHAGVRAVPEEFDIVAVHDAVRPLVSVTVIDDVLRAAENTGGAVPVIGLKDTILLTRDGGAFEVLDRDKLRAVQTPQAFTRTLLLRALDKAAAEGFTGTDEASLVERLGETVYLVRGDENNIKITTPRDIVIAAALLDETP